MYKIQTVDGHRVDIFWDLEDGPEPKNGVIIEIFGWRSQVEETHRIAEEICKMLNRGEL